MERMFTVVREERREASRIPFPLLYIQDPLVTPIKDPSELHNNTIFSYHISLASVPVLIKDHSDYMTFQLHLLGNPIAIIKLQIPRYN